ncbi:MAG TPA: hypothetical protein VHA14_15295 [Bryobacteraceae bacterium]|nr:hypothetical protein [Bryobacteraceae bacterium]
MSTLKNLGIRFAGAAIAAGMFASAAFASIGSVMTVDLPQAVTVGSAVLPSGQYSVTQDDMNDGTSLFVFRSNNGKEAISAVGLRNVNAAPDQKTSVVLDDQNGTLHLDKMFIAGHSFGYRFASK